MVNVTINGKTIQVKEGTSILQAAKEIDVRIPTLCHNPDLPAWASLLGFLLLFYFYCSSCVYL